MGYAMNIDADRLPIGARCRLRCSCLMVRVHSDDVQIEDDVPEGGRALMREFIWLRCIVPCMRHRHEAEAYAARHHQGPKVGILADAVVPILDVMEVTVDLVEVVGSLDVETS